MKTKLLIGVSFIAIVCIATVILYLLKGSLGQPSVSTSTNPFGFTESTSTASSTGGISLHLKDGSYVGVQNFVATTQPEWANPTYGYQVTQDDSASYSILYYPNNSGFLISLLKEPIGQSRLEAERFLKRKVSLTPDQFCKLHVQVFTSVDVNGNYAGQDLGLSFCPGSVKLPQ
jgi:hypothetical protein